MREVTDAVTPKVTPEMNAELFKPYSVEEIKVALFHPSKVSKPDGMSPLFYQKFWHVVGADVVEFVRSFLVSGRLLREACFTHVVLFPKVYEPQDMTQLRPISLCNVVCKIGAKVLANRHKRILNTIISPHQSAFVMGRLISDNSLVATEIGHFLHNKRRGRDIFLALKLDLSKAYDLVEWKFLETMMVRLGFAREWIRVVMACVSSISYYFLVNGELKGYVVPSRGLRQGDPFSPYLFLLCVEGLSAFIAKKSRVGLLAVCGSVTVPRMFITYYLQMIASCLEKQSFEECAVIQHILDVYSQALRKAVNFSKSSATFSANVGKSE